MRIKLTTFAGIIPKIAKRLLPDNNAQTAENVNLLSGKLKAIKGLGSSVKTLPDSDRISIFPYNDDWLSWTTDVDVARSPIKDDSFQRIYITGDGIPKVRGIDGVTEEEFTLGLPIPTLTPTITTQQKADTSWTRDWAYRYEEPDGTISQSGSLTEGAGATEVVEVVPGKQYTIDSVPARSDASADAVFIYWFNGTNSSGSFMGSLFPNISINSADTDFILDGAAGSGTQINSTSTPEATLDLTYDTSLASDYTIDRSYVYTHVSSYGEEGPPSTASSITPVDPTQDAVVSNMSVSEAGFPNIELKRIYRTATGLSGATSFLFVAEIPVAQTSYTDTFADSELGEVLPSTNWLKPPTDLAGIVAMPGGFLAGFSGKTAWFSDVSQPHAWPTDFALTVDFPIVGLGVSENSLVVMTEGTTYSMFGFSPDAISVAEVPLRQACVSKRGIAKIGSTVLYPSPDGLVAVEAGVGKLVSEKFYERDDWQELTPLNLVAEVHDKIYHGWSTGGSSVIFDLDEGRSALTTTDVTTSGLHSDDLTDTLYLIVDDDVVAWRGGSTNLTMTWKTKLFQLARRWSPSVLKITADTYPITVRLFSNGNATPVLSITLNNDVARRIPVARDSKTWEFQIEASSDVHEAVLSDNMREL